MIAFQIRPINKSDHAWINDFIIREWGSVKTITRQKIHYIDQLPGFIASQGNKYLSLATHCIENQECELISLNSLKEGTGIGTSLLEAVKNAADAAGCNRLWLITTNDNLHALRFYQKRGYFLKAIYPKSVEYARNIKPEIPLTGNDGIPLRDEIEIELPLPDYT